MKSLLLLPKKFIVFMSLTALLTTNSAWANGEIGEHVNNLAAHLDQYTEEVNWMIAEIDKLIVAYGEQGAGGMNPERVTDVWEEVDFHAAIEVNYVPIYASIWQGLFGVRMAMEGGQALADVRSEQVVLEQTFWQALGAVRLASQFQQRGLIQPTKITEATTPLETMNEINARLDGVIAKHAEQLPDEATEIVHDTYLTLFEGLEGMLIEQDADLVVGLEVDFNVTLPQALARNAPLDDVRTIVQTMHDKLDQARTLIEKSETNRASVF